MGWSEQDEHEYQQARLQIESEVAERTASLNAETARLREELADVAGQRDSAIAVYEEQKSRLIERAERAEARIAEAEKREPDGCLVVEFFDEKTGIRQVGYEYSDELLKRGIGRHPVFLRPIPPADVAELQAKLDEAQKSIEWWMTAAKIESGKTDRIAELECKLSEAAVSIIRMTEAAKSHGVVLVSVDGYAELNTLLAKAREEGRKEAVPEIENIREVNLRGDFAVQLVFSSCRSASAFAKAMLAAAPKPEVEP